MNAFVAINEELNIQVLLVMNELDPTSLFFFFVLRCLNLSHRMANNLGLQRLNNVCVARNPNNTGKS